MLQQGHGARLACHVVEDLRSKGAVFVEHLAEVPAGATVVFSAHGVPQAVRQEADARGIFLGDEVMDYMLSRFSRDLGSLMQLLGQLDAYALQTQRAITIPLLKAMLESE